MDVPLDVNEYPFVLTVLHVSFVFVFHGCVFGSRIMNVFESYGKFKMAAVLDD